MDINFDDLDEVIGADAVSSDPVAQGAGTYVERCTKCNGSGTWRSWGNSGRAGACFACKGVGSFTRRTSPETRAKARVAVAARKDREAQTVAQKVEAWRTENSAETAWLERQVARGNDFGTSLVQALNRYGDLTEGQLAAVRKGIERDAAWATQRTEQALERAVSAPEVSIAAIETAFQTAIEKGVRSPKLRLDTFTFSPAKATSANPGAIYVKEGDTYLGKIAGSRLFRGRDCDGETEARIVAAASDPKAAGIAYGRRFGSCCICARELTNHASIELGIGPICAEKYGW
jgi:hypothetical protein